MLIKISILVFALCLNLTAALAKPAPAAHKKPPVATSKGSNAANTAYVNRLRGRLMNNWHELMQDGKNHVVITALVNAVGSVENIEIVSSPKNNSAEQAGNEAFAKSQPLEPLPTGTPKAKLTMTFDSFSDPHGDSNSNIYTQILPILPPKLAPTANAEAPK